MHVTRVGHVLDLAVGGQQLVVQGPLADGQLVRVDLARLVLVVLRGVAQVIVVALLLLILF